jgi:hypothetical protein
MNIEDQVLQRIVDGCPPAVIQTLLGVRPDQYYSALDSLTESGILSKLGDLPEKATTELCPPPEAIGLLDAVFADSGWSKRITDSIRALYARYGGIEPPSTDPRYTRSRWTGHSYRRVDFMYYPEAGAGGIAVMVVGALIPLITKHTWQRAVPKLRMVYIESPDLDLQTSLVWERGRVVSPDAVSEALQRVSANPVDSTLLADLVLSTAWVCESRALLATKVER